MDALDVARWQFGITTVYHFIFVPLTIGLSILVAGMQTAWHRTKNPVHLRMTKSFGKLFLINFAMGVVTGIVQEFQFGMNWSDYSRFVGDVFGAPLAMEGLRAGATVRGVLPLGVSAVEGARSAGCPSPSGARRAGRVRGGDRASRGRRAAGRDVAAVDEVDDSPA